MLNKGYFRYTDYLKMLQDLRRLISQIQETNNELYREPEYSSDDKGVNLTVEE